MIEINTKIKIIPTPSQSTHTSRDPPSVASPNDPVRLPNRSTNHPRSPQRRHPKRSTINDQHIPSTSHFTSRRQRRRGHATATTTISCAAYLASADQMPSSQILASRKKTKRRSLRRYQRARFMRQSKAACGNYVGPFHTSAYH
jgi:hypothetical protein